MTHAEGNVLGLFAGGDGLAKTPHRMLRVDPGGALGDRHHGRNADRALLLVPEADYAAIRVEGIDLPLGSLGENLVVSSLPSGLPPGTRLRIGACDVEVTGDCTVCASLSTIDPRLPKLAYRRRGVYVRVGAECRLHVGDEVRIVSEGAGVTPRAQVSARSHAATMPGPG